MRRLTEGYKALKMSAKQRLMNLLQSGTALTAGGSILATGGYVIYKDHRRVAHMQDAYAHGNLLPPLAENKHEVTYFRRPELEAKLRHVLKPTLSNEYYLINGEVGSGKTRTLVELVRELMSTDGGNGEGAPVFVSVSQGKSFPDTLAEAVNFLFDEHISFKFFLDFVLRIHSFPSREDHHKMTRVLDAIEVSAFDYLQRTGKPVVLVIDGANYLAHTMPGTLERLQMKAKLWADTNIAKVVFVSNDEATEALFQENSSNWSRAAVPIAVGDISRDEAIAFLTQTPFLEVSGQKAETDTSIVHAGRSPMSAEAAEKTYDLVGGRLHHLLAFKRDWSQNIPFRQTAIELRAKEREKFIHVARNPEQSKAVEVLMKSPDRTVWLKKLIEASSEETVKALSKYNVIRLERCGSGIVCKFESRLTEVVMERFFRS